MVPTPSPVLLERELAVLGDAGAGPERRALAVATLCAALKDGALDSAQPGSPTLAFTDNAARMFEYATRHAAAPIWDGRSTRSGTITFVDAEWIEQYVGQQQWIAYRQSDLGEPGFLLGDQVRIGARDGGVKIEAVGSNRLPPEARTQSRTVCAGMYVVRVSQITPDELLSAAQSTAARYGATLAGASQEMELTFSGGGRLVFTQTAATSRDVAELLAASRVVPLREGPVAAVIRIEVRVDAQRAQAALEAEGALVYSAALLTSTEGAIALDDSGAILSADQLYDLAVRDQTRAALFDIAARLARRVWPARPAWFSDRTGVCDELVVYFRRPWRADYAAAALKRNLEALADALRRTGDPVIPARGILYDDDERGSAAGVQRLVTLSYDTVEVDVGFVDAQSAAGDAASQLVARADVAALLGGPIACAIVIAFGNCTGDGTSDCFAWEMRCANIVATALAAGLARRDACVAGDARGTLFGPNELVELALQRRGTAAFAGMQT